jgi:hypothetical protein
MQLFGRNLVCEPENTIMKLSGLLLIAMLLFIGSCAPKYYMPNGHNVPMFKERGEARASLSSISVSEAQGVDLQTAFAISSNTALMLNGFFVNKSGIHDSTGQEFGASGLLLEAGAGYFMPINRLMVFEVYGGGGGGNLKHRYLQGGGASFSVIRGFVQPQFGISSRVVDAAFSLRLCGLGYTGISNHAQHDADIQQVNYLEAHPFSVLVEPSITLRGGWKYVKLQLQFIWSVNLSHPDFPQDHYASGIGLTFSFAERYMSR